MAGVDRPMMEAYLSELEQLKKMLKAARKIPGKAIASVMTADTFMKPLNFDSAATLLSLPLVNAANKSNAASTASGVRSTLCRHWSSSRACLISVKCVAAYTGSQVIGLDAV